MIPFGKKILGAAGRVPGARRAGRFGARVGRNTRLKYGEKVSQGKYISQGLAMFPAARPKVWGKPFTKTSKANRDIAVTASANWQRTKAGGRVKPDFFPGISAMSHGKKKAIGAAGLVGIGAYGFTSGIDEGNRVSNSVYNLAFNNPDYDKHVMGKKMGVRSLIAPLPGELRMQAYTPKTYADAWRANRKTQPTVNGSIAFGMYNSRLG